MADLHKIDIRVGTIERVGPVPRSDKLVRLTVDFGDRRCSVLVDLPAVFFRFSERAVSPG
jgi:tRNA-binding protein